MYIALRSALVLIIIVVMISNSNDNDNDNSNDSNNSNNSNNSNASSNSSNPPGNRFCQTSSNSLFDVNKWSEWTWAADLPNLSLVMAFSFVYLSIYLSIFLSYLSIYLSMHLSMHLSIYSLFDVNRWSESTSAADLSNPCMVAIFCPFGLFCEIDVSLPSL